jgi:hypothetical protein
MMFNSNEIFPCEYTNFKTWIHIKSFIINMINYLELLNNNYNIKFTFWSDVE